MRRKGEKMVLLRKKSLLDYEPKSPDPLGPIYLRNSFSLKGLPPANTNTTSSSAMNTSPVLPPSSRSNSGSSLRCCPCRARKQSDMNRRTEPASTGSLCAIVIEAHSACARGSSSDGWPGSRPSQPGRFSRVARRDQESLLPDRNGRCPGMSRRHRARLEGWRPRRRPARRRCAMRASGRPVRERISARQVSKVRRLESEPSVRACSSQSSASRGLPRCMD